ncbi:B12-binding domain-containing protein [Streptomyces sp. NPDC017993]|uniref:B12-binding domain-containing protein n=1 Tax=Streptomyces sp. NPDC017993 TaxID=3365027 RepID=UPI0037A3EC98
MSLAITADARAAFDRHLAHGDEAAAAGLAVRLVEDGVSAEDVLLDLVGPAQVTVGARWAAGEWTVAQEHAATHVSEQAIAAVSAVTAAVPHGPRADGTAGGVLVACSDGEWHVLPARILSEVLRLRGHDVRFLGGHVPEARLVSELHQTGPDLVALSCTLPMRLPLAHRLIQACRPVGVPVLAGGTGFGPDGIWARTLGADLYAADAPTADELLRRQWPPPLAGRPSIDPACAEAYAQFVRRRSELLHRVVARLHERHPALRDPTDHEYDTTTANLSNLLDSLAAAVFVDDTQLFTDFLSFATAFLTARSLPPDHLGTVLETPAELLRDAPLFMGQLDTGRGWLANNA